MYNNYDDYDEFDEYDGYEEEYDYSEFMPDPFDTETSFAEDFEKLSKMWKAMTKDTKKVMRAALESMDEYEDAFIEDGEDDPEFMRDRVAFNGIRVFAGMYANAAETIGNFLDAASGMLNGCGPMLQIHTENESELERTYRIGDHLKISRGVYTHHGLYAGDGMVIHYSQGYDAVPEIRKVPFGEFAGISKVMIVPESESPIRYSPDEIIRRAESRLGERNYNLIYNNCENFVRWCRAGG